MNQQDRRARRITNAAVGGAAGAAVMYYIVRNGQKVPVSGPTSQAGNQSPQINPNQKSLPVGGQSKKKIINNSSNPNIQDVSYEEIGNNQSQQSTNQKALPPASSMGNNQSTPPPNQKALPPSQSGSSQNKSGGSSTLKVVSSQNGENGGGSRMNNGRNVQDVSYEEIKSPSTSQAQPTTTQKTQLALPPGPGTQPKSKGGFFQNMRERFSKPKEPKIVQSGEVMKKNTFKSTINNGFNKSKSAIKSGFSSAKSGIKSGFGRVSSWTKSLGKGSSKGLTNSLVKK